MIRPVNRKLKKTVVWIVFFAKGFLPIASILVLEVFPKEAKPIIKAATTANPDNKYLKDSRGANVGASNPLFKTCKRLDRGFVDIN